MINSFSNRGMVALGLSGVAVMLLCGPASWSQTGIYDSNANLPTISASAHPGLHSAMQAGPGSAIVGPTSAAATGTQMITAATLNNGSQQIVIVDQSRMTAAVYHIEPSRGDIQLKSVRRLDADFTLQEFNLSEPTPTTIRKNLRVADR